MEVKLLFLRRSKYDCLYIHKRNCKSELVINYLIIPPEVYVQGETHQIWFQSDFKVQPAIQQLMITQLMEAPMTSLNPKIKYLL